MLILSRNPGQSIELFGPDGRLLATMTYKAADIIHFDGGRISKGAKADLVLIDLNHEWKIDPEKFYSKSKNSPFVDTVVKGRAVKTVVGGVIVYQI